MHPSIHIIILSNCVFFLLKKKLYFLQTEFKNKKHSQLSTNMWKNFSSVIRGGLVELNRAAQRKEFSLLFPQRTLPSSNLESVQTAPALRLVTAFYGVGKDVFFNQSKPILNKKQFSFGDDSW